MFNNLIFSFMAKQQNPDYVPKIPRTPHDLSQDFIFTSPAGPLLPIFYDRALPGDKYSLQSNIFIRTNPLLTAAMADLEFYVDWFFVPATMIYTPFQSLAWQTQDLLSSNYPQNISLPLCRPSMEFSTYTTAQYLDEHVNYPNLGNEEFSTGLGFECIGKSAYRLLMHLGLNPQLVTEGIVDSGQFGAYIGSDQPDFFPWQLLSYHAIYYKHYRNEDFEPDCPIYRNWDKYAGQTVGDVVQDAFYCCHYAPRKRDYFLSIFPTPLVNNKSLLSNNLPNPSQYLTNANPVKQNAAAGGVASLSDTTQIAAEGAMSTAKLRSIFAFEKLLRIVGRAEKDYDSQVLAHFGYKVPHDYLHNLTFIGSQNGRVHIGEVISTAGVSGGSELGEIAGKGYGKMNARELQFTAPCHGALMAIFYIKPVTHYYCGIDRLNFFSSMNDVYQPEYDKLGKQPLYAMECFPMTSGDYQAFASLRLGWQWRYQERKRKVNRVSICFAKPDDLYISGTGLVNPWSAWVLTRRPFASPEDGVKARDFVVSPSDTDQIMSMHFQPLVVEEEIYLQRPWEIFQYDPFIINSSMNVSKVSVMSKFGEPDIDSI